MIPSIPTKKNLALKKIIRFFSILTLFLFFITIAEVFIFKYVNPPFTPLMIYRTLGGDGIDYQWKPLRSISSLLQRAVIAAEDQRFAIHCGFDFNQINTAIVDHENGKKLRGASTITMQTSRNLFLWQGHSWIRKFLEAYYSVLIEMLWDKKRILEVYLNIVEWGKGIFGSEAAAKFYFKTSAATLNKSQAALLAAVLPNPRKWSPVTPSIFLLKRKLFILNHMNKVELVEIPLN